MSTGKICMNNKTVENCILYIFYLVWSFFCSNTVDKILIAVKMILLKWMQNLLQVSRMFFSVLPTAKQWTEQHEEVGWKNLKISARERLKRCHIRNLQYGKQGRICLGLLFRRVWVIFLVNNQMVFLSHCPSSIWGEQQLPKVIKICRLGYYLKDWCLKTQTKSKTVESNSCCY